MPQMLSPGSQSQRGLRTGLARKDQRSLGWQQHPCSLPEAEPTGESLPPQLGSAAAAAARHLGGTLQVSFCGWRCQNLYVPWVLHLWAGTTLMRAALAILESSAHPFLALPPMGQHHCQPKYHQLMLGAEMRWKARAAPWKPCPKVFWGSLQSLIPGALLEPLTL